MSDATDHQLSSHPPVTDWTTDFDHAVDEYAAQASEIWDELRSRPGGEHLSATAACGCRRATKMSPPSPTTPSTSPPARSW
ncbi:MAG: hypothetical protein R2699_06095 [Acidimicrobiales bacterium]